MHAQLVGPARPRPQQHQGITVESFDHLVLCQGCLAARFHAGEALTVARVPRDALVDDTGVQRRIPHHYRHVSLPGGPFLELVRQESEGFVVVGGDDDAGSILIKPVDDARTEPLGRKRARKTPEQQGVGQRPRTVSRPRMDHQSLLLVHHDHPLVFVDHGQRKILRLKFGAFRFLQFELQPVPALEQPGNLDLLAVHPRADEADL